MDCHLIIKIDPSIDSNALKKQGDLVLKSNLNMNIIIEQTNICVRHRETVVIEKKKMIRNRVNLN